MSDKGIMTIDGIPVEIGGEKNLLELIRKVGIELPTFCYHSDLSIHGACRMCMVEDKRGGLAAACSEQPRNGMEIRTNTERLRQYRKNILELLLANHCRDCTTCFKSGDCKLQELALRYNINNIRFANTAQNLLPDNSSSCIDLERHKCILCGDCVRMCNEIQKVGAIDFAWRGSKMTISTAFKTPIAKTACVGCGQCAVVCPTGAITIKNDTQRAFKALSDPETLSTVQIAPAVRVALGREFGIPDGENVIGKIVAALRRIGFHEVYDTVTGADFTIMEEAKELIEHLEENREGPMFTSCCPAWVNYCEKNYPEFLSRLSTSRSPMQMLASVVRERFRGEKQKVMHMAVMPCTAKKFEAARREFTRDGTPLVDIVLTTQGLIRMIRESGIVFSELDVEPVDSAFNAISGAGVIFGVTGGVTEAVLRRVSTDKTPVALRRLAFTGVRGMAGVKEATIEAVGRQVKIAVVSGLGNAADLIEKIKTGAAEYDFVEVMACPGGCINGAGQPFARSQAQRESRGAGLYAADRFCTYRRAEDNPLVAALYAGLLKGKTHELLHVEYERGKTLAIARGKQQPVETVCGLRK